MKRQLERTVWIDLLRVSAICLMMLYHLCGKGMWWATTEQYQTSFFSVEYRTLIFFHMISRICIPVLLMISGMFLLDPEKELSIKKLFAHNILRIFLSLVFWNALYSIYYTYQMGQQGESLLAVFKTHFFETHYHLEFLYALIGIYIITPVLRIFTKRADKHEWNYLLLLFFICISVIPTLQMIHLPLVEREGINYVARFLPRYISASSGIGYVAFYMMGYYLKKYGISEKLLKALTVIVIFCGIVEVIGKPYFPEVVAGLGYYDIGTMFGGIVFVCYMKKEFQDYPFSSKNKTVVALLAKWSFGAYLVHDFVLQFFINDKSYILITSPVRGIIIDELIVVAVSFGISALFNELPIIRKYFV